MTTRKLVYALAFAALAVFTVLMIRLSWPYTSFRYDVDFLLTKQRIIHLFHWRTAFYIHVFLSWLALLAGFTQFLPQRSAFWRALHKRVGYIYVADIVFFAAPSGLIMAFYANGGVAAKLSFVVLSCLWWLCTFVAYRHALKKKFDQHRKWMIRSYALTLSAITLRLLAIVLPALVHLSGREEYTLMAWLSWMINLLVAEVIIRWSAQPKVQTAQHQPTTEH